MASEQLGMIIEGLAGVGLKDESGTFVEQRANLEAGIGAAMPPPEGTTIELIEAGGVRSEWVSAPGVDATKAILYFHGGAYTIGSINTHRRHVALLSAAAGAPVLNVDYRLAPEDPHPAALDDACAAYRWLTTTGGIAPDHIVVCGDSAGGGLTMALLVALRDAGDPLPAGGALMSPWVDLAMTGSSHDTRLLVDPMCSRDTLQKSVDAYAGTDVKNPLVSPVYADLRGLPPLVIHVGDHEVLLDDSIALTANAEDVGVPVELWVAPEMIHVWHLFAGIVPESDAALARLGDSIRAMLA